MNCCYRILIEAVSKNQLELVSSLIKNSKETQQYIDFALFKAAQLGHLEIFAYLVSKGADPHWDNDSAFKEALHRQRKEIVSYINLIDTYRRLEKENFSLEIVKNQKVADCFSKYVLGKD